MGYFMQSKYDANKQRYPDARASEPAFTSYLTEQDAQYQFFTQAYHDTVAHIAAPLFGWNAAKIQERINIRDCARFIITLMNALEETKQCVSGISTIPPSPPLLITLSALCLEIALVS